MCSPPVSRPCYTTCINIISMEYHYIWSCEFLLAHMHRFPSVRPSVRLSLDRVPTASYKSYNLTRVLYLSYIWLKKEWVLYISESNRVRNLKLYMSICLYYTLRKKSCQQMSKPLGFNAETGRARCQHQVAFLIYP